MSDKSEKLEIDDSLDFGGIESDTPKASKTPDEFHGFHIEAFLKIFDPETKTVFVSTRA